MRLAPVTFIVRSGIAASAAAFYTAALGGKMVYGLGVGINPMPVDAVSGTAKETPLLSLEAPRALVHDALQGARWLLSRARGIWSGVRPLHPGAKGFGTGTEGPTVGLEALVQEPSAPGFQPRH